MKKTFFLLGLVCLLAISAFAQEKKTTDFSGVWELDASKSKLNERFRIEGMTRTVTQTATEIKIEDAVKRSQDGRGGGMGRGGMGGGTTVYTLDGKEKTVTQDTPMGAIPVGFKAKFDDKGNLKLTQTRTLNTQMGVFTLVTKETWTLSEEGKLLTVKSETDTPQGTIASTMVFNKKDSGTAANFTTTEPKKVSGGVLNSKVVKLLVPVCHEEARAAKAEVAASVQVTIDELGKVISAEAVSEHALLRKAS